MRIPDNHPARGKQTPTEAAEPWATPKGSHQPTKIGSPNSTPAGDVPPSESPVVRVAARLLHFQARVLADCLSEATADYWNRRADQFEDAAPRDGDFNGQASADALSAARERCLGIASACRARASLEGPGLSIPAFVWAELLLAGEVAK